MADLEVLQKVLYDKSYTCPLCGESFKSKAIRSGKNQLISVDLDLYAHYSLVNPLFYSVIACPHCGYSVLTKTLAPLLPKQKEWLSEHFSKTLSHTPYSEYATIDEVIKKYKMALLACMTRKSHISEQGYIALSLAWLYRDLEDTANEQLFLKRAFSGFCEAFSKERFPIIGMDELTFAYSIAAIAYEIGELEESKKYLSMVLTAIGCPPKIKDRALELKQIIFSGTP